MNCSRALLCLSLLVPCVAGAQTSDRAERVLRRLDEALDLSDAQEERLRAALEQGGGRLRDPEVREALAEVLTDDQRARLRERLGRGRGGEVDMAGVRRVADLPYVQREGGSPGATSLDLYAPEAGEGHPVLLFVHGGGWRKGDKASARAQGAFFAREGFLFVSTNYRLVPAAQPGEQVGDVLAALVWLRDHAAEYGGDPARLFLMGHSAGAHLAALAAVDAERLAAVGLAPDVLSGVVLLDGAGYDLRLQIEELARGANRSLYLDVFGSDPAAWGGVSPVQRVTARAAPFLILHVAGREASRLQSEGLGAALRAQGGEAEVRAMDKSHATIYRDLGRDPQDPLTASVLEFLAQRLR